MMQDGKVDRKENFISSTIMNDYFSKFITDNKNGLTDLIPTNLAPIYKTPNTVYRRNLDNKLQLHTLLGGEWILILWDNKSGMTEQELMHLLKAKFNKEEAEIATDIVENNRVMVLGGQGVAKQLMNNMFQFEREYYEFFRNNTKREGKGLGGGGGSASDVTDFVLKGLVRSMLYLYTRGQHGFMDIGKSDALILMLLYTSNIPMTTAMLKQKIPITPKQVTKIITDLSEKHFILEVETSVKKVREVKRPTSGYILTPKGTIKLTEFLIHMVRATGI